ncbi:MAG TPA: winged helix-turn-helix domain-containing protein [Vicinamibacterales bacterium]|nr:winged helix-turn-helix domain-containing protein [Vicinamibacterales bacterium]
MAASEVYEFGAFSLDVSERRLSRQGRDIALEPRTYDLLVGLVRHAGRLMTKRELLDLVWREAFVEDGILSVHVSHLRKLLGDTAGGPAHIETVPKAGYRFIAPVTRREPMRHPGVIPNGATRPEVHELVGRGRDYLLAASMHCVPKAVAAFREAVTLEPAHAAAHAGLALACCALADLRLARPGDAYAEAKSAALRALAMDDTNSDARVALGAVLFLSEWNWTAAERCLQRALELNPDHTEAYLLYGRLLEALGRLTEGLQMKLRALERDPKSPLVHLQIAMSYWNQREYDAVINWTNKTLELDPRHPHAREFLAGAYLHMGDIERHFAENLRHAELHGVSVEALAPLKRAYDEGGRRGIVRYVLEQATKQPGMPPAMLAVHYAEAGELDAAFAHLHRAIEGRDPMLVHLAVAPQWDPLRHDPRLADCLGRMGLPAGVER